MASAPSLPLQPLRHGHIERWFQLEYGPEMKSVSRKIFRQIRQVAAHKPRHPNGRERARVFSSVRVGREGPRGSRPSVI